MRALTARAEAELAGGDRRAAAAALSEADEIMRTEPVLPGVAAALRAAGSASAGARWPWPAVTAGSRSRSPSAS